MELDLIILTELEFDLSLDWDSILITYCCWSYSIEIGSSIIIFFFLTLLIKIYSSESYIWTHYLALSAGDGFLLFEIFLSLGIFLLLLEGYFDYFDLGFNYFHICSNISISFNHISFTPIKSYSFNWMFKAEIVSSSSRSLSLLNDHNGRFNK